jgi:rhamnose transport system permease protein
VSTLVQSEPSLQAGAAPGSARHLVDLAYRFREHGIVAVLALFVIATTAIQPRFLNSSNIKFTLLNATIFGFLALGQTVVIVSRNVDLSVGSILGLSAYLSSAYLADHPGTPIPLVFALGLAIGLVCGMVNGAVTALGRVPSLVVTIATLYIIRGVDTVIVGGEGGRGELAARLVPEPGHVDHRRNSRDHDRVRRRDRRRRLLPSQLPLGA